MAKIWASVGQILMQLRGEIWASDHDLSNGLCDIPKCSWSKEVYYQVLPLSSFLTSEWGRRTAHRTRAFAKRHPWCRDILCGSEAPTVQWEFLESGFIQHSFACSACVIAVLPVSTYLIFIDFFFQAELTQNVNFPFCEAEGTLLEHKVASTEHLPFKEIWIIVATYEYFGDIDHSPECWDG